MSRPILMTDEMKENARKDFEEMLNRLKMSDGKLNYSKYFSYENCNATVFLTPVAYQKIVALVTEFSDEVAWHGSVTRGSDTEFTIEDIFVYPQEVSGSTVDTDQKTYTEWLYGLDDEVFNKIRMQGHSHVNMGVNPSNVDENHRQKILEQLDSDMFYVFMIWNKSLSVHTLIYDMSQNILYEDKDIEVKIVTDDNTFDFMADAKNKVQKRNNTNWGAKANAVNTVKSPKRKSHKKTSQEYDDFDDFSYGSYGMIDQYDLGGNIWTC